MNSNVQAVRKHCAMRQNDLIPIVLNNQIKILQQKYNGGNSQLMFLNDVIIYLVAQARDLEV